MHDLLIYKNEWGSIKKIKALEWSQHLSHCKGIFQMLKGYPNSAVTGQILPKIELI